MSTLQVDVLFQLWELRISCFLFAKQEANLDLCVQCLSRRMVSESGGTPKSAPSASLYLLLLAFSFELRDTNAHVASGRGEDNSRMCVAVPTAYIYRLQLAIIACAPPRSVRADILHQGAVSKTDFVPQTSKLERRWFHFWPKNYWTVSITTYIWFCPL